MGRMRQPTDEPKPAAAFTAIAVQLSELRAHLQGQAWENMEPQAKALLDLIGDTVAKGKKLCAAQDEAAPGEPAPAARPTRKWFSDLASQAADLRRALDDGEYPSRLDHTAVRGLAEWIWKTAQAESQRLFPTFTSDRDGLDPAAFPANDAGEIAERDMYLEQLSFVASELRRQMTEIWRMSANKSSRKRLRQLRKIMDEMEQIADLIEEHPVPAVLKASDAPDAAEHTQRLANPARPECWNRVLDAIGNHGCALLVPYDRSENVARIMQRPYFADRPTFASFSIPRDAADVMTDSGVLTKLSEWGVPWRLGWREIGFAGDVYSVWVMAK